MNKQAQAVENQDKVSRTEWRSRSGLARPGAKLMLVSAVLLAFESIGPLWWTAMHPNQDLFVLYTGLPAFGIIAGTAVLAVLYCIGFLNYCASKGYSRWLGFFLLLCNLPGFIILLMLPQR